MTVAIAALLVVPAPLTPAQARAAPDDTSGPVLEIRSYNLKSSSASMTPHPEVFEGLWRHRMQRPIWTCSCG
jgi:hypothetical protein